MMAQEQVKLLMQSYFSKTGDVYEPVMITMSLHRSVVEQGEDDSTSICPVNTNFPVPLITLLPLNSLAVEEGDIHFGMNTYAYKTWVQGVEDKN